MADEAIIRIRIEPQSATQAGGGARGPGGEEPPDTAGGAAPRRRQVPRPPESPEQPAPAPAGTPPAAIPPLGQPAALPPPGGPLVPSGGEPIEVHVTNYEAVEDLIDAVLELLRLWSSRQIPAGAPPAGAPPALPAPEPGNALRTRWALDESGLPVMVDTTLAQLETENALDEITEVFPIPEVKVLHADVLPVNEPVLDAQRAVPGVDFLDALPAQREDFWRVLRALGVPGAFAGSNVAYAAESGSSTILAASVVEALKAFRDGMTGAVRALGDFTAAMVSPDANPASFVQSLGAGLQGVTEKFFFLVPPLQVVGSVLGSVAQAGASLMRAFDGMVDRYAEFSPEVAVAQGMAEVAQTLGDLRRSREVGPDLVRYIEARTELQQKVEDLKVRFINAITPALLRGMEVAEKILPLAEATAAVVSAVVSAIDKVAASVGLVSRSIDEGNRPKDIDDPTTIILERVNEIRLPMDV